MDHDSKDNNDNDKIIRFPALEERAKRDAEKKQAEEESERRARAEELWRKEYQAQQANNKAAQARARPSGKVPFINWHRIPPFTRLVLGACLIVHLYTALVLGDHERLALFYALGFTPAAYTGGDSWSLIMALTPVTSLFIHSGWLHFVMNIFMMLAMGAMFENRFGTRICVIFFLLSGLTGSLFYLLMDPFATAPVIGASGAISGLFAANMLMMADNGMIGNRNDARGSLKFLILWMTIIIATGFIFGGIAWQAHLGGFLCGAALYVLWKKGKIRL